MKNVLVLNATYEPLSVIETSRAVTLLVLGKAQTLETTGEVYSSATEIIPVPSVIRLNYMVNVPRVLTVPLSRRALFARDNYTCQYCLTTSGHRTMEVEHVARAVVRSAVFPLGRAYAARQSGMEPKGTPAMRCQGRVTRWNSIPAHST